MNIHCFFCDSESCDYVDIIATTDLTCDSDYSGKTYEGILNNTNEYKVRVTYDYRDPNNKHQYSETVTHTYQNPKLFSLGLCKNCLDKSKSRLVMETSKMLNNGKIWRKRCKWLFIVTAFVSTLIYLSSKTFKTLIIAGCLELIIGILYWGFNRDFKEGNKLLKKLEKLDSKQYLLSQFLASEKTGFLSIKLFNEAAEKLLIIKEILFDLTDKKQHQLLSGLEMIDIKNVDGVKKKIGFFAPFKEYNGRYFGYVCDTYEFTDNDVDVQKGFGQMRIHMPELAKKISRFWQI